MKSCHFFNRDEPRGYSAKRDVRQRKRNTIWLHLYVEFKNKWTNKTETDAVKGNKKFKLLVIK